MPTIKEFNNIYSDYLHGDAITDDEIRASVPSLREAMLNLVRELGPTEYLMGVLTGEYTPIGFDISDKAVGVILTIGDEGTDKNRLAAVCASQADTQGVPVSILTSKMVDWPLKTSDNVRFHDIRSNSKLNILQDLVNHIQTPADKRTHPTQLFVIDSLPLALDWLGRRGKYDDKDYLDMFQTILEKGKENGIMTFASMNTDRYSKKVEFLDRWISYFPERIFGMTKLDKIGYRLGDPNSYSLSGFIKGVDFRWVHPTADGPESMDFWIPRLNKL